MAGSSREKSLVKNTLILSLGTFTPKLMSFITLPLLTQNLSKAEYGTYDLITVLVMVLLPVVTLQIHTGAFRYLIECRGDNERTKGLITNALVYAGLTSLICLAVTWFFMRNIRYSFCIVLYLFFDMYLIVTQQFERGLGKNLLYSISSIINSAVFMVLTIILVSVLQLSLYGAIISLLGGVLAGSLYLTAALKLPSFLDFRSLSKKTIKLMLGYSWPIVPNSLCNWVLNLSDRLIVTAFLGIEANAVYAVENKLPNLLTIFQSSFSYAWQENASLTVDSEDSSSYYESMYKLLINFLAGGLALLIGVSPLIFRIVVRGDYDEAYPQIAILYLAIYFNCISSYLAGIYAANKKTVNIGVTTIIAAGINLFVDLMLVKHIGIYAASLSTLVSYIFLTLYRMKNIQKFQKIRFKLTYLLRNCLLLTILLVLLLVNNLAVQIINFVLGAAAAYILNRSLALSMLRTLLNKVKG
ncbi:MAG: oligosaccharide flippase family protein [Clostridiales bacterium]|nr:oligosaccharide flippase family protein [Clostridiales bacterium]